MMQDRKNILILGVNDRFGEQVVEGLIADDNAILLCGDDRSHQKLLAEKYAGHIKGVSTLDTCQNHKQIQSMIEKAGSLDAVIYLVGAPPAKAFLDQSHDQINEIFMSNLITPVCLLQSLYPYLRKSANCKVIFVDTDIFEDRDKSSVTHLASNYGLWGFCEGIKADFQARGIDVRSLSSPSVFYSTERKEREDSRVSPYAHYRKVIKRILEIISSAGRVIPPSGYTETVRIS